MRTRRWRSQIARFRTGRPRWLLGAALISTAIILWLAALFLPPHVRPIAVVVGGAVATAGIGLITTSY